MEIMRKQMSQRVMHQSSMSISDMKLQPEGMQQGENIVHQEGSGDFDNTTGGTPVLGDV